MYLTSVQFILQLKLRLYTFVHLLLEQFKIYFKSPLSIQSLCHTVSPRVGVWSPKFSKPRIGVGVDSHKKQGLRTLPARLLFITMIRDMRKLHTAQHLL